MAYSVQVGLHCFIFYTIVSTRCVHSPLQSAPYWQKQFKLDDFNGDNDRWIYAAMVLEMDHAVGCVVNATRDFGLYS